MQWEAGMDFIERIFGIAPDGGDGSLEMLWIVALVAVVGALVWRRRRASAQRLGRSHEST